MLNIFDSELFYKCCDDGIVIVKVALDFVSAVFYNIGHDGIIRRVTCLGVFVAG